MSLFRPTRTIRARDGTDWEIYVYRVSPVWRPFELADELGGFGWKTSVFTDLPLAILELPLVLLGQVILPLVYALLRYPFDLLRWRRSRLYHVEAVAYFPREISHKWRTCGTDREAVVAQLAAALADGRIPWSLPEAQLEE